MTSRNTLYLYQGDDETLLAELTFADGEPVPTITEVWFALSPDGTTIAHEESLTGGGITMPDSTSIRVDISQSDMAAIPPGEYSIYCKYRTNAGLERHVGNRQRPQTVQVVASPLVDKN